jgi:hypothetical protein
MNNFRMWAYALIATGFINWDYQRSAPHAMAHSLLIIIWGLIGVAALAYAFLN